MHQKLSKAQSVVSGTRAQAPTLKDGKEPTKVWITISLPYLYRSFVQDEKEKKKEENQLTKSVRDRWDQISSKAPIER
jgi:hypothetical protein